MKRHQSDAHHNPPRVDCGENPMVGNDYPRWASDVNYLIGGMPGSGKNVAYAPALVTSLAGELARVRAERAALWQLLKDQTRAVRDLRVENDELETARWSMESELTNREIELDQAHTELTAVRAERGCSS